MAAVLIDTQPAVKLTCIRVCDCFKKVTDRPLSTEHPSAYLYSISFGCRLAAYLAAYIIIWPRLKPEKADGISAAHTMYNV